MSICAYLCRDVTWYLDTFLHLALVTTKNGADVSDHGGHPGASSRAHLGNTASKMKMLSLLYAPRVSLSSVGLLCPCWWVTTAALEDKQLGFSDHLCNLVVVWLYVSSVTCLCLGFLLYKVRTTTSSSLPCCGAGERPHMCKGETCDFQFLCKSH